MPRSKSMKLRRPSGKDTPASSKSSSSTTPEKKSGGLFVEGPKKKRKRGYLRKGTGPRARGTPWGNLYTKAGKARFHHYLENLKDAKGFIENRRGILFYRGLSNGVRKRIRDRLKEVDPEGCKTLVFLTQSAFRKRRKERDFLTKKEQEENIVAVEVAKDEEKGTALIKFVKAEGFKRMAVICLAAGYDKKNVAEMLGMELPDFNNLEITDEDVREAQRRVPEAVVTVADQIVLRDLLKGDVKDRTEKADRIASRRRKLVIDALGKGGAAPPRQIDAEQAEERERKLSDRFGVDRKKGRTIDVKTEEDNQGS